MDLSKLTPAPWEASRRDWRNNDAGFDRYIHGDIRESEYGGKVATGVAIVQGNATSGTIQDANAEFIALARNAFDVMMRRGWKISRKAGGQWRVDVPTRKPYDGASWECLADDPFTALIEADRWYREHVERIEQ